MVSIWVNLKAMFYTEAYLFEICEEKTRNKMVVLNIGVVNEEIVESMDSKRNAQTNVEMEPEILDKQRHNINVNGTRYSKRELDPLP